MVQSGSALKNGVFAASTDIVNFDTIRNSIRMMASNRQKDANVVCFGPIVRDRRYKLPSCGNKCILRGDYTHKIWDEFQNLRKLDKFNSSLLNYGYITGLARMNAGVRGITMNKQNEAIVTIPYMLDNYQNFKNEFTSWAMDLYPTSKMSYDLPPQYKQDRTDNWRVKLDLSPKCPENHPYLSLVKTARNNTDNRNLIRIHYETDLRKSKEVPFPAVRFLIGRGGPNEDKSIAAKLEKEMSQHDDIIIGGFEDIYDNLPLKVIFLCGYYFTTLLHFYIKFYSNILLSCPKISPILNFD